MSTNSLDKDKEEGITTSGKKGAEEDPFSPTSSPGKGKEKGNSLDDTKEVEEDSKGQRILLSRRTGVSIKSEVIWQGARARHL